MNENTFRVRIWGARGSLPVSGPEFAAYGGNTICLEVRHAGEVIVFDAGSGIRPLGQLLSEEGPRKLDLFLTHCHYDHIIGLPYFAPLYIPGNTVTMWSGHLAGRMTTRQILGEFMRPPWFPVGPTVCGGDLRFQDFKSGDVLTPRPGITLRTASLNHPGGCIGYRLEWGGRSVALISDTEHVPGETDENVLGLIKDVDLFIYDAAYTEAEMPMRTGFGHSTWNEGVRLARLSGAKRMAIFHHAPYRTDGQIAEIEAAAQAEFDGAFAARDGQILDL